MSSSPVSSVEQAVLADLEGLGSELAGSSEAAAVLELARELDAVGNSATSKSMCARALGELMAGLRERAPARPETDGVASLQGSAARKLRAAS